MRKSIAISLMLVFILTSGFGCKAQYNPKVKEKMKPITLTYWRVWDENDAFDDIIAKYNALHPFITIKYKKFRIDEYEQALLEAFATDRGPDIFSIHNTWIGKYKDKGMIVPMPASVTMVYPEEEGALKKEIVPHLRTTKSISLREIKNNFVDVVYDDVVIEATNKDTGLTKEEVFGLPLSVDTLAMFYNKDLINNAGISVPPEYWNRKFQQDVKKLTKQDAKGQIIQAGVSLGGSENIDRFSDILSALMMQNGAEMMGENGIVSFHAVPAAFSSKKYNPGLEALRFYTDFANPAKEVYSWNNSLDNSLDMFVQGKLGIMFGYAYHLPVIKSKNPKLDFSIVGLPQIEGNSKSVNFANYWVESVSNKSKSLDEAWDFIQFETREAQVKTYLEKTKKPTALRSLINEQVDDFDIGIFASQVLTAKSWYRGVNALAAEAFIGDMIDEVVSGGEKIESIISVSAKKVQQTIKSDN